MILYLFALIGALTSFLILVALLGIAYNALTKPEIVVAEKPRELVPLVPAVARKRRADVWVN